ncbi:unnamed protein product [Rhizophagus irregularis]|nr:unnamed protein product [Rhizophagus irregularis]
MLELTKIFLVKFCISNLSFSCRCRIFNKSVVIVVIANTNQDTFYWGKDTLTPPPSNNLTQKMPAVFYFNVANVKKKIHSRGDT